MDTLPRKQREPKLVTRAARKNNPSEVHGTRSFKAPPVSASFFFAIFSQTKRQTDPANSPQKHFKNSNFANGSMRGFGRGCYFPAKVWQHGHHSCRYSSFTSDILAESLFDDQLLADFPPGRNDELLEELALPILNIRTPWWTRPKPSSATWHEPEADKHQPSSKKALQPCTVVRHADPCSHDRRPFPAKAHQIFATLKPIISTGAESWRKPRQNPFHPVDSAPS